MSLLTIRRIFTCAEDCLQDAGRPLERVKRTVVVCAVIANPYAGRYVEDLSEWINEVSPTLGELLAKTAVDLLGQPVEAYGKAAIVGIDGEVETGSAIIHTLKFGDPLRNRVNGRSLLPAVEKVGPPGCTFDIPLKHKDDDHTRSHHQTYTVSIPDAPARNEIVVGLAVSNSGRPHARIGEFGQELGSKK